MTNGVSRSRTWILVVKVAITACLLALLLWRTPLAQIADHFRTIPAATICAAILLLFAASWLIAVRWRVVLRRFGGVPDLPTVWRYTLVGSFFNQILPSGMGGDVFRVWYARNFAIGPTRAIASVIVDRVLGFLAIALIVLVGTPFVISTAVARSLVSVIIVASVMLAVALCSFLFLDVIQRLLALPQRRIPALVERVLAGLAWTAKETRRMLIAWPDGMTIMGLSLAVQLLVGAVMYLLLLGVGQLVSLATVIYFFPVVLLVSMLPISFAGWGLREGAMVVVFAVVGVPANAALTASLLYGLCLLAASLPGAGVWLLIRHASGMKKDAGAT